MKFSAFWCALLLIAVTLGARAQLVAPPTIDWVSIPTTATFGQSVSVGVGAHANPSDNSDGNDWNSGDRLKILRVIVSVKPPGGSWATINDWIDPWRNPAEIWTSFTVNAAGTYSVRIQLMDGRPWYSDTLTYDIGVPSPIPAVTSQLSVSYNQRQGIAYQITATNSPSGFSASNLPPGVSINTTNGVISGAITSGGTWTSTISATNASGTGSATLTWNVTGASLWVNGSVSPNPIYYGASVTLNRDAGSNFGISYLENWMLRPNSGWINLGDSQKGSASYTPNDGAGAYSYWVCVHDIYGNTSAQTIAFTVTQPTVSAPTNVSATTSGSTFVSLSWTAAIAQAGVDHYNVYRDGSYVGRTNTTTYTDSTVSPSSSYAYTVYAVDTQNHVSDVSQSVYVVTARVLEVFTPLP